MKQKSFPEMATVRSTTGKTRILHVGVQALLLGISMVVPFSFPLVFGFDEYGKFVVIAAGAFLVQRYCDAAGEPLVVQAKGKDLLRALIINHLTIAVIAGTLVVLLTKQGIHWLLLVSLLGSSIAFAFVSQMGDPRRVILYLSGFTTTYITCIVASLVFKLSLVDILIISNGIGAIWGMVVGRQYLMTNYSWAPRQSHDLASYVVGTFTRIGACAFAATLAYGLPIFVAPYMTASEIGIVRFFVSVVFLAPFLLPVNQKSLLPILKEAMSGDAAKQKAIFSFLKWQAVTSVCWVGICIAGGSVVPSFQLHFLAVGLIPIFMSIIMAERVVIVSGRLPKLASIGTIGAIILWLIQISMAPRGLNSVLMGVTIAIAAYASLLSLALGSMARYWIYAYALLALSLLAPIGGMPLVVLVMPSLWLFVLVLANKSYMTII